MDEFDELMQTASELPHTRLRMSILEEATRRADSLGDEGRAYLSRMQLLDTAGRVGCEDLAFVALAWCLAHADRRGEDFADWHALLAEYAYLIERMPSFPAISREQIEEALADFERRCDRRGIDRRRAIETEWTVAVSLGDTVRAHRRFDEWRNRAREALSRCRICDAGAMVWFHSATRDFERALAAAEPLLDETDVCGASFEYATAHCLESLAVAGRFDQADDCSRRAYRRISRDRGRLGQVGDHLLYLAHRGNRDRGLRLFERHLPWAFDRGSPCDAFDFLLPAASLLQRCAETSDRPRRIALPDEVDLELKDGRVRPSVLADWLGRRAVRIAGQLDARNGNDLYSQLVGHATRFAGVGGDWRTAAD